MSVVRQVAPQEDAREPGVRLELGVIAGELGITVQAMADAAGMSRRSMQRVLLENAWPLSCVVPDAKKALRELLTQHGANPEQLAWAFRAHVRNRTRFMRSGAYAATDYYGRGDAAPPTRGKAAGPLPADQPDPEDDPMLMAKQSLTQIARRHFQIFTNPFDGEVTSDEQMFINGEIRYVIEAALQTVTGARFVAIVSESGGGKSTILEHVESLIERDKRQAVVIRPSVLGMEDNDTKGKTLKSADILHAVITTLDPLASVAQTLQARTRQTFHLLTKSAEAGYQHMVLIEEAHSLPTPTLKHLKRLNELKMGRKPLLGILLVGQSELKLRLDPRRADLREVTQRCEVVELLPLDADLKAYLQHRAKAAGADLGKLITDAGIEAIRQRLTMRRAGVGGKAAATSLLYPLVINNLMTAALNAAADIGVPVVDADVVRGV